MKLNNKGFAITTILYGTLILFLLLFSSVLGILSTHKSRLNILINSANGARDIVTMRDSNAFTITCGNDVKAPNRGFYKVSNPSGGEYYSYFKYNDEVKCTAMPPVTPVGTITCYKNYSTRTDFIKYASSSSECVSYYYISAGWAGPGCYQFVDFCDEGIDANGRCELYNQISCASGWTAD